MVVKPKMAQPVELDEEPIDLFNFTGWKVQKHFLSSKTIVQSVKVEPQSIEVEPQSVEIWSKGGRGPTVTYQALNTNG